MIKTFFPREIEGRSIIGFDIVEDDGETFVIYLDNGAEIDIYTDIDGNLVIESD
jgi:hypothetical protein